MSEIKNKVNFDLIRYANCWEDADVLLQGLDAQAGSRILSVCSAGDNSFSLLSTGAELVVAVDVSRIQLYLAELKKAAFAELGYEEFLGFLGFLSSSKRTILFNKIKTVLSKEARSYWESNIMQIEEGIIFQGKFEKYFSFFKKRILPLIHNSKRIDRLFTEKSPAQQEEFYHNEWNNWRWRLFFRLFFSKPVMGKFGRDPEFLKEVNVPVSRFIFDKAEKHLKSTDAQKNYFLHFIHKGDFGTYLPHYARKENFEKIKNNIDKLILKDGFAQDAIREFGAFDHMNLSNIFEYMDAATFKATAGKLVEGCKAGGRLAYWNLMVPRKISNVFPEQMTCLEDLSQSLSKKDKGFFYNAFITDQKL
jgi:S-adenosylmethionine-diacylglycerol 3-amino-3-carboxypropyl transferase